MGLESSGIASGGESFRGLIGQSQGPLRLDNSYSVWLMPQGVLNERLASLIRQLGERYHGPVFAPHLTLVGGFPGEENDLKEKLRQLAGRLEPFEIRFGNVESMPEFFRSVFIRVQKTRALMQARQKAEQVFGLPLSEFTPHISLAYGVWNDATKKEMIEITGERFSGSFLADCIHLAINDETNLKWAVIESVPIGGLPA